MRRIRVLVVVACAVGGSFGCGGVGGRDVAGPRSRSAGEVTTEAQGERSPAQGYPSQGHPPQGTPAQGYPSQGHPPQGTPAQGYPSQGHPAQGYAPQGHPPQGPPAQGYAPQGHPPQGAPAQGYPPQGYPPQGYAPAQGYPPPGAQAQGYPPQGYPPQGYAPAQGHPQGYAPAQAPPPGYAARAPAPPPDATIEATKPKAKPAATLDTADAQVWFHRLCPDGWDHCSYGVAPGLRVSAVPMGSGGVVGFGADARLVLGFGFVGVVNRGDGDRGFDEGGAHVFIDGDIALGPALRLGPVDLLAGVGFGAEGLAWGTSGRDGVRGSIVWLGTAVVRVRLGKRVAAELSASRLYPLMRFDERFAQRAETRVSWLQGKKKIGLFVAVEHHGELYMAGAGFHAGIHALD